VASGTALNAVIMIAHALAVTALVGKKADWNLAQIVEALLRSVGVLVYTLSYILLTSSFLLNSSIIAYVGTPTVALS